MTTLEDVAPETLLAGRLDWAGQGVASRLAEHPLDAIETEYPHYVREVESPEGPDRPREQHPVFYGCYDWHSAVHSHWALVRQLRRFDDHPDRDEIVDSIDSRVTPENVAREVAYLAENPAFEKPYGWAWFLHLAAELHLWDDPMADSWRDTLSPLEDTICDLVESEFLTIPHPFRVGTHGNSAFALHCILDYARTADRPDLADAATAQAREWYVDDTDYPVEYEPLGWDFLSPALTEADLLRRILPPDEYVAWLEGFLPALPTSDGETPFDPTVVDHDPDEGVALHLVGMNLSRSWGLAGIADALEHADPQHPAIDPLRASARDHAEQGVAQAFTEDYAGTHWLSSFVLYLCSRNEPGIGPEASG